MENLGSFNKFFELLTIGVVEYSLFDVSIIDELDLVELGLDDESIIDELDLVELGLDDEYSLSLFDKFEDEE